MKSPDAILQKHFLQLGNRWKMGRMLATSGWLLGAVSLLMLVLGFAILRGWVERPAVAVLLALAILPAGGLAFIILLIIIQARDADCRVLASATEAAHPPLLDRLNTISHLEAQPTAGNTTYLPRIRAQAADILTRPIPNPNWSRPAILPWSFAVVLLVGAVWFYVHWKPWTLLRNQPETKNLPQPETNFELASATAELAKTIPAWGEVRITEPGRDLKLTKVDVLQLKIEAAASQPLADVNWQHQLNEQPSIIHPLPAPTEPQYSASEDFLYLDELKLSDWDVITYSAQARTTAATPYVSEIYFIEIRPFQSDLAKMPGGEGGEAAKAMNEISELITRQQQILRETHHFQGTNYSNDDTRKQDREKLATAEGSLKKSADLLYAKTATTLENEPIGDILEALALGGESMRQATTALDDDAVPAARQHEQSALQSLIASRKNLQKFISEHPEAFGPQNDREPVSDPLQALAAVTEFRDRQQAARKEVDALLEAQKKLQDDHESATAKAQQEKLRERLEETRRQHPDLFRGVNEQADAANEAMQKAAAALDEDRSEDYAQNRAVDRLQDLQQALAQRDPARATEQALKMKQLLDTQTRQMQQAAQGTLDAAQLEKLAQAAGATTAELQDFAKDDPPGFGPQLSDALSEASQAGLAKKLADSTQGTTPAERQAAAGAAGGQMQKISDAFTQSLPKLDGAGQGNGGKGVDALSRALRQMQGLVQRGKDGKPLAAEVEAQLRAEALADLQIGLKTEHDPAAVAAILARAESELKESGRPVNVEALKKLLDEIESFRIELSDKKQREQLQGEVRHVEAPNISPLYRERVEAYYRKLSEQ